MNIRRNEEDYLSSYSVKAYIVKVERWQCQSSELAEHFKPVGFKAKQPSACFGKADSILRFGFAENA